jgi:drug/metabolite transporter superfamily protein YnfA
MKTKITRRFMKNLWIALPVVLFLSSVGLISISLTANSRSLATYGGFVAGSIMVSAAHLCAKPAKEDDETNR